LTEGLKQAGLTHLGGADLDRAALATYRANHGACALADVRELSARDVLRLTGGRVPDLLAGSPPCQSISALAGFSAAGGGSREADTLYLHVVRLARELGVRAVLMENVARFLTKPGPDGAPLAEGALRALRAAGYDARAFALDAADFGVPQRRRRAFVLATRGLPAPAPPAPRARRRVFSDVAASPEEVAASVAHHSYEVHMSEAKAAYYARRAAEKARARARPPAILSKESCTRAVRNVDVVGSKGPTTPRTPCSQGGHGRDRRPASPARARSRCTCASWTRACPRPRCARAT